jgi:hypothetical protein
MKTLKKITLASAIAAAPFMAQAELTPMDDTLMGNTTGQAGVTVEINIDGGGISVGEIEYTDEGSVLIQNVQISNVNNLTQTIDVNTDGDLEIGMGAVDNINIALAGDGLTSAVALKSVAGDVTELVNNVDMQVDVGPHTTYIRNLASRSAADITGTGAGQLGLPTDAAGGSVAIQSTVAVRIDSLNVGAFGYTDAQATVKQGEISAGVATSVAGADLKAAELIAAYNTATGSTVDATVTAGVALTGDQETAVQGAIANGAAVKLTGVEFYKDNSATGGLAKDYATISQNIWAKGGSSALGGGVYIQIGEIAGTLDIGAIEIGGASIGSVKVSDINLAGLTQRIYGH